MRKHCLKYWQQPLLQDGSQKASSACTWLKRRNLEVDGLFGLANTFGVMSPVGQFRPRVAPWAGIGQRPRRCCLAFSHNLYRAVVLTSSSVA